MTSILLAIVIVAILWAGFAVAWRQFMDWLADREFEREWRRADDDDIRGM